MSGSHRLDVLRSFYYQSIHYNNNNKIENTTKTSSSINENEIQNTDNDNDNNDDESFPKESYWCSEYHKCHSYLDDEGNLICILYNASVPSYTMR